MKVETSKSAQNGYIDGSQRSDELSPSGTCIKKGSIDCNNTDMNVPTNGTIFEENQQDAFSCSSESPLSISDVLTNEEESFSSLISDSESLYGDQEVSDLDDIVTSTPDVHHAAIALETFLESMEFVPAEINRLLKLIGLLDEKCEEITELLDRPCSEWFESSQRKKQKKYSSFDEEESTLEEDSMTNIHSTKAFLIYRKIYEGQEDNGFDAYIAKLKKAKKLQKQKQLEYRTVDFSTMDDSFQIHHENNGEVHQGTLQGEISHRTPETTHTSQNVQIKASEAESAVETSHNTKTTSVKRERGELDPIDHYFAQFDKEDMLGTDEFEKLLDNEGLTDFDPRTMNESWKERLQELQKENASNQKIANDMEVLNSFLEEKLSLLWRYTLRKKALTRKLYDTALHNYASLLQELEPQKFTATLGCYPEATIMQNMLLNDVEEDFVNANEMLELYKDISDMVDQFDEKELVTNPNPQMPLIAKAEDISLVSETEVDRNVTMNEAVRADRQPFESCFARPGLGNGTLSTYAASTGSIPACDRSDVQLQNGNSGFRRARNKRHKPTKPPAGMAHAAKSPQSTGRLLTYHDIATSASSAKLLGHPAELFWPDDDLWYLIRINTIDPETKTANIVYLTGEIERLELDDIVREGHMSLLPEAEDTDVSMEEGCPPRQANDGEVNEDAMSELSVSEPGALYSDEASVDGDDEECGTDDDDEEMVTIHHRRPPRRNEIKSERVEIHHKS